MGSLQTVYAYRDAGWMSEKTRWKPRRVFCTDLADHSDRPGVEHVVKFRQAAAGAAALVSEVLCTKLLRSVGYLFSTLASSMYPRISPHPTRQRLKFRIL